MGKLMENVKFNNRYEVNRRVWDIVDKYNDEPSPQRLIRSIYEDLIEDNIEAEVYTDGIYVCIDILSVDGVEPPEKIAYKFLLTEHGKKILGKTIEEFISKWGKELNDDDIYKFEKALESYLSERLKIEKKRLIVCKLSYKNKIVVDVWNTDIHTYINLFPNSYTFGSVIY